MAQTQIMAETLNVAENYGTNPLPQAANNEKVNPFAAKFTNGIRLQFAILPQADESPVGDILGAAQVWVNPGTGTLNKKVASISIPIYRAGTNIQLFKNSKSLQCTLHYVATLGPRPYTSNTANQG